MTEDFHKGRTDWARIKHLILGNYLTGEAQLVATPQLKEMERQAGRDTTKINSLEAELASVKAQLEKAKATIIEQTKAMRLDIRSRDHERAQ